LVPLWTLLAQEIKINEWESSYKEGLELIKNQEFKRGIPYLVKSYEIAQDCYKNDQLGFETYFELLSNLDINFRKVGDFDNSIKVLNEKLNVIEKAKGKSNKEYRETLNDLSISYRDKGDYENALNTIEVSNSITVEIFGEKSNEYAYNLSLLSKIYVFLGDYNKALPIQETSLSIFSEKDIYYASALFAMSKIYLGINEYQKAIDLLLEGKQILEENPKYDKYIINFNNDLALAYDYLGDYENALTIALEVTKSTAKEHPEYPTRLMNLGIYYTKLGENRKAENAYDNALEICLKIYSSNHKKYVRLIEVMGQHYYKKGDYEKAKEYFEEALPAYLKLKNLDESYPEYGRCLNYYASTLLELDQNDEAIDLLNKNINISKANSRTDNEWYLRKQIALGKAYIKNGQFDKASAILEEFGEQFRKKLGVTHPDYADILHSKGKAYLGLREFPKAIAILDSANTVLIDQIDKVFKFRSEKEKRFFLRITNQNFDELQSIAFNLQNPSEALNKTNLNNQIMLKGLLLNNSKNILTQLNSCKNDEIDKKIIEYRTLKNLLSKNLSLSFLDRKMDVDSLYEEINVKEAELVKLAYSKFETKTSLIVDWKSSKKKLRENDLAIEFSHFKLTSNGKVTDSIMYVAYLYKSNWNAPVMAPLFEEKELEAIISGNSNNKLYNSTKLYELICTPIEEYLKSSKTIYYSPSGLLNQISFSALKNDEHTLSANYNLVQLSSTGVLAEGLTEPGTDTTLFIGGINYDYKNDHTAKADSSYTYYNSESFKALRGTKTRGESWTYLPNTLKEIKDLQSILNSEQKLSFSLTASDAKETVFKKQSGKSANILHIATHGFFFENMSKASNDIGFGLSTEDHYRSSEDPLLRSGLIMAGANYAWKHGNNPYEADDGIVNAMEISNLDLFNTDIVVLSACETGLGDIDGSEGVYGLQRAFKMAGVDIVVMSLWKVPDAETAEFMTLFYTNWIAMKNVRKAFNETQRAIQKKYRNQPENWAAFVLFE